MYFKSCPELLEIFNKRPPNPQDRLFLSLSQCGYRDGQPLVCCRENVAPPPPPPPTTTQSTIAITSAPQRSLLPKPGECGIDAENRIYGGNATHIDEYPWMVLLQYSKRKKRDERKKFYWIKLIEIFQHKIEKDSIVVVS